MSRTKRNQARTIRLGRHLAKKKNEDGSVRDGTPTHHGASCSRGGSCGWCASNRQFDKIKTEEHSKDEMKEAFKPLTEDERFDLLGELVEEHPVGRH